MHVSSHIHVKRKQKVTREKRNETHSKRNLHYIGDTGHNDPK